MLLVFKLALLLPKLRRNFAEFFKCYYPHALAFSARVPESVLVRLQIFQTTKFCTNAKPTALSAPNNRKLIDYDFRLSS